MINELLKKVDIIAVKQKIIEQCQKCQSISYDIKNICYEPYSKFRKGHFNNFVVISAFRPNDEIGNFKCRIKYYGIGQCQPELYNENIILHFYNYTNPLDSALINEYIEKYNIDNSSIKYFIIRFKVSSDYILEKLDVIYIPYNSRENEEIIEI